MIRRLAKLLLILAGAAPHAAEDVSGSSDPAGIERFPRSWIVEYNDLPSGPYEFVTAPVDRIKRVLRVEAVRVQGPLRRVTYRMSDQTRLDDVIAHYEARVGAASPGIVFSCRGPDCGRSTIWANHVFGVAELAAPNRNQFYLAAPIVVDGETRLVAVYAVQRGNRRVYAHLDVVVADGPVAFGANRSLAETLARDGFAVVDGVVPDAVGALTEAELERLSEVAATLGAFRGETIHVVCHLHGSAPVEELARAAERCAGTAATTVAEEGGVATAPHGLGPIAPGSAGAGSRIEFVLPYRLRSD